MTMFVIGMIIAVAALCCIGFEVVKYLKTREK